MTYNASITTNAASETFKNNDLDRIIFFITKYESMKRPQMCENYFHEAYIEPCNKFDMFLQTGKAGRALGA